MHGGDADRRVTKFRAANTGILRRRNILARINSTFTSWVHNGSVRKPEYRRTRSTLKVQPALAKQFSARICGSPWVYPGALLREQTMRTVPGKPTSHPSQWRRVAEHGNSNENVPREQNRKTKAKQERCAALRCTALRCTLLSRGRCRTKAQNRRMGAWNAFLPVISHRHHHQTLPSALLPRPGSGPRSDRSRRCRRGPWQPRWRGV